MKRGSWSLHVGIDPYQIGQAESARQERELREHVEQEKLRPIPDSIVLLNFLEDHPDHIGVENDERSGDHFSVHQRPP